MSTRKLSHAIRFATALASIWLASATFAAAQYTATTIYTFPLLHGCDPIPLSVTVDGQGNLFGTADVCGSIFELSPGSGGTWTETVLQSFPFGAQPGPGVAFDSSGNYYFTNSGGASRSEAIFQRGNVIHYFNFKNGATPNPVIVDAAANVFGTTQAGGSSDPNSQGVVYKVALDPNAPFGRWVETVLHRFTGGNDGGVPIAGLTMDADGNLYGTASQGGLFGHGTVYKLTATSDGKFTFAWIHAFTGDKLGGNPMSPLLMDASGNLYGTTAHGGIRAECGGVGCGVVFELVKSTTGSGYTERVLHTLQGKQDGQTPLGLVADAVGNLYSSTPSGNGFVGSVFKLSPANGAWQETILLTGNSDLGGFGPLTIDSAGNLFGPASGSKIFELSPPGTDAPR